MPSYKETFGRCILEGMASGVPVIASNAGGVPDIISDLINGCLFESKNIQDLFKKTISLIENPKLFAEIQKQARHDIETKYDQDFIWTELYNTITFSKKET